MHVAEDKEIQTITLMHEGARTKEIPPQLDGKWFICQHGETC